MAAGLALSLGALAEISAYHGSRSGLLERKGHIASSALRSAGDDPVSCRWELTVESSTGLRVRALLRAPRAGRPPYPAAVIVGGIKRGRRVLTVPGLDAIASQAVIVSPDYPVRPGRDSWKGMNLPTVLLGLRPAAFDMVAHTLLLLDYLETRADVEPRQLFLIGGSMGATVVSIAGGIDARPAAVVALYGGARLPQLIAYTLEHGQRQPYAHWQAVVSGHALAWLVFPLDPARYVGGISPRPFLMVNGSHDSLIPRDSVRALYEAARRPKDLIWVGSEHIEPTETDLLGEVSGIVTTWLTSRRLLGDSAGRGVRSRAAADPAHTSLFRQPARALCRRERVQ